MYAIHCGQPGQDGNCVVGHRCHAGRVPGEASEAKKREGRNDRTECNDAEDPVRAVVMVSSVVMSVDTIMPARVEVGIGFETNQREHELAKQHRATNNRANAEE